ncbi:MAG TPA: hypothetical protein VJ889_19840, partial [Pseudomonas sp.]|nr:hypothetical protein [Pseudomonas sp.]
VTDLANVSRQYEDLRRPVSLLIDGAGVPRIAFGDARGVFYGVRGDAGFQPVKIGPSLGERGSDPRR